MFPAVSKMTKSYEGGVSLVIGDSRITIQESVITTDVGGRGGTKGGQGT